MRSRTLGLLLATRSRCRAVPGGASAAGRRRAPCTARAPEPPRAPPSAASSAAARAPGRARRSAPRSGRSAAACSATTWTARRRRWSRCSRNQDRVEREGETLRASLSSDVLFESGSARLQPGADDKLVQIADGPAALPAHLRRDRRPHRQPAAAEIYNRVCRSGVPRGARRAREGGVDRARVTTRGAGESPSGVHQRDASRTCHEPPRRDHHPPERGPAGGEREPSRRRRRRRPTEEPLVNVAEPHPLARGQSRDGAPSPSRFAS